MDLSVQPPAYYQVQDARARALLRAYRAKQDTDVLDRLVAHYFYYVRAIAKTYAEQPNNQEPLEDLMSIGLGPKGLLRALETYQEKSGPLIAWVGKNVHFALRVYQRRGTWTCVPPTWAYEWLDELRRAERHLHRMQRAVTPDALAAFLGLSLEEYERRQEAYVQMRFPDTLEPFGDHSLSHLADPADFTQSTLLRLILDDAVAMLPARQQAVIRYYYFEEWTQEEIGERLGCTRSNVQLIHAKACANLRKILGARTSSRKGIRHHGRTL